MSYIKYKINPDDPEETEINRSKAIGSAFGGFVLFMVSLWVIVYFVRSLIELNHLRILLSLVLLAVFAILDFLPFLAIEIDKKHAAKIFFLNLLKTLSIVICLICGIISIAEESVWGLIISIVALLLIVIALVLNYMKKRNIHFFTKQDQVCFAERNLDSDSIEKHIFCHKCGKKLLYDSNFCSFCGAKIYIND